MDSERFCGDAGVGEGGGGGVWVDDEPDDDATVAARLDFDDCLAGGALVTGEAGGGRG